MVSLVVNIEHLSASSGELEAEEFEDLLSCMMRPIRFVESLESLQQSSSSIIYLMKVERTVLKLQSLFSQMKQTARKIQSLDQLQRFDSRDYWLLI